MTRLPDAADAALEPLREALLADAHGQAEANRHAAEAEAAVILEAAEQEAARIRAKAAAAGEEVALSEATQRSARVRRESQEVVLAAQNEVWLGLRRSVRQTAEALRTDPRYPALQAVLRALAAEQLGADAVVAEADGGGVFADAGARRLDLSLGTLAGAVLDSMGPELPGLWEAT
ncbi:MAG TPA: hypothetical protein VFC82_10980 [Actinomycetaceae bacterium]|nr:hypothetical protein [Actinomycetaceae bacterium]